MREGFKIAFFGLPLAALALSSDRHKLGLIVLSPTAAPGRRRLGRRMQDARVLDARTLGDALDPAIEEELERLGPDLIVSWFWTRLLKRNWLETARLGGIGVHPSLLPSYRGRDPYFWAIDSGDALSGVTVHRLTPAYDEGAIIAQQTVTIGDRNSWQLARALDRPSLRLLRDCVMALAQGNALHEVQQDEARVTLAPEPSAEQLRADFRWPSERVLRRVRALSPVPGLAISIGDIDFFVTQARATTKFPTALEPGEAAMTGSSIVIRTGDGAIALERAVLGENSALPELGAGEELDERTLGRLLSSRVSRTEG